MDPVDPVDGRSHGEHARSFPLRQNNPPHPKKPVAEAPCLGHRYVFLPLGLFPGPGMFPFAYRVSSAEGP
jgi:hypothetical protein